MTRSDRYRTARKSMAAAMAQMANGAVVLLVLSLPLGCATSRPTRVMEVPPDTRAEDVARLEAVAGRVSEFSTRIVVTTLTSGPIEAERIWDDSDWMEQFCLDWVSVGGNHRFETWISDPVTRTLDTNVAPQLVATWDGSEFRQQFTRQKRLVIKDQWMNTPEHQFLSAFNQCDGPSPFQQWTLAGLLREAEVQSIEEDGSQVTYSLVMPEMRHNTIEMEFDREPHMRLLGMGIQIRSLDSQTGEFELSGDVQYRVLEWGKQGDVLVPLLAVRDSMAFPAPGSRFGGAAKPSPFMNRIVLKRTTWAKPPSESSEAGYFHAIASGESPGPGGQSEGSQRSEDRLARSTDG